MSASLEHKMFRALVDEWNNKLSEPSDCSEHDGRCRICMQSDSATQLLAPCRCIGTVKHVHEACLKAWILAQGRLTNQQCELCKAPYQMEYCVGRCWRPSELLNLGEPVVVLAWAAVLLLALLAYLAWSLWAAAEARDDPQRACLRIIFGMLCVLELVVFVLLVFMWTNLCLPRCLKYWRIFSQTLDPCEFSMAVDAETSRELQWPPQRLPKALQRLIPQRDTDRKSVV